MKSRVPRPLIMRSANVLGAILLFPPAGCVASYKGCEMPPPPQRVVLISQPIDEDVNGDNLHVDTSELPEGWIVRRKAADRLGDTEHIVLDGHPVTIKLVPATAPAPPETQPARQR
jgi:hypothetical protein